jgi:hypothetical protein
MTETKQKLTFEEWQKLNPPKCKCCEKLLPTGFAGYMNGEINRIIDIHGERVKGLYCCDCADISQAILMNEKFVEVYRDNIIFCKEDRYLPYWESALYFNSVEDVRTWIDYRLGQMEKARKEWLWLKGRYSDED